MKDAGCFAFEGDGRAMIWPYPEKVHPKKARVARYDMYVMRIKEACLHGDPDVFFTTDHYNCFATVIVRLDVIDEAQLAHIVRDAWEAAPLPTELLRPV
jgi:hypothetical protein